MKSQHDIEQMLVIVRALGSKQAVEALEWVLKDDPPEEKPCPENPTIAIIGAKPE